MEELSFQNQQKSSSFGSTKESKVLSFLLILLCLVILLLLGEGVYFLKLKREKAQINLPSFQEIPSVSVSPHPILTFAPPVKQENLVKGKTVQLDYGINDWAVFLPEGEGVYAGFSGFVEWAGEGSLQKVIMLKSEDGKLTWKYLFVGEPLIQNGQQVEKGQMIAKLGSEPLPTYDVNLVVQAFKEGKRVNLEF